MLYTHIYTQCKIVHCLNNDPEISDALPVTSQSSPIIMRECHQVAFVKMTSTTTSQSVIDIKTYLSDTI